MRLLDDVATSSSSPPEVELGPLGEPIPLDSALTENSTFYERSIAGPDSATKQAMWIGWSIAFLLIAAYSTAVLVPIVATKKTRRSPFNVYLIFLMIPDSIGTWLCGSTCLTNALKGYYAGGAAACYFQSFYLIAFMAINAWLNAATARQLLIMLRKSANFVKYQPPKRTRVALEAMACYVFGFFVASWGLYRASDRFSWWPSHTWLVYGILCVPQAFDDPSMVFFYTVYFPAMLLIPFLYVLYAALIIWKQKLLPPSGKRRVLAIYFVRLSLVFILMWIPTLVALFISGSWTNHWFEWFGGLWGHCQVAVSTTLSLLKPDIGRAVFDFYRPLFGWLCCRGKDDAELDNTSYFEAASFQNLRRKTSNSSFSILSLRSSDRGRKSSRRELKGLKVEMKNWNSVGSNIFQHSSAALSLVSSVSDPMVDDGSSDNNDGGGDEEEQGVTFGGLLLMPAELKDVSESRPLGESTIHNSSSRRSRGSRRSKKSAADDLPDDFSYDEEDTKAFENEESMKDKSFQFFSAPSGERGSLFSWNKSSQNIRMEDASLSKRPALFAWNKSSQNIRIDEDLEAVANAPPEKTSPLSGSNKSSQNARMEKADDTLPEETSPIAGDNKRAQNFGDDEVDATPSETASPVCVTSSDSPENSRKEGTDFDT